MKHPLDAQLINYLAAAIEPAVCRVVEDTVRDVLHKYRHPLKAPVTQQQAPVKKGLMTVKDVAEYLSVGNSTVWAMVQRGELPSVRVGGGRRFCPEDVEALAVAVSPLLPPGPNS